MDLLTLQNWWVFTQLDYLKSKGRLPIPEFSALTVLKREQYYCVL